MLKVGKTKPIETGPIMEDLRSMRDLVLVSFLTLLVYMT